MSAVKIHHLSDQHSLAKFQSCPRIFTQISNLLVATVTTGSQDYNKGIFAHWYLLGTTAVPGCMHVTKVFNTGSNLPHSTVTLAPTYNVNNNLMWKQNTTQKLVGLLCVNSWHRYFNRHFYCNTNTLNKTRADNWKLQLGRTWLSGTRIAQEADVL